jgi:hypothetical protein
MDLPSIAARISLRDGRVARIASRISGVVAIGQIRTPSKVSFDVSKDREYESYMRRLAAFTPIQ